ncbi:MAG: YesL family protein [Lachnospiraceae bacterium]|nr:YesL family protein [Lachnospiraceae bacterium]
MQKKKRLFSADPDEQTGFWRFMTILFAEFFDLIKINLLFMAISIAVVTLPAAVTGMAAVTMNMMEGKNHFLMSEFFEPFRKRFLRCFGIGVIFFAAGICAVLSILLYTSLGAQMGAGFYFLTAIAVCILILEQMLAVCAFPLLALTDLTAGKLLLAAKDIAAGHAARAFGAAAINLSLFTASALLNPGSIIFTVFIEFSLMSFIASYLMFPALKPYLEEAEGRNEKADSPERGN